MQVIIYLRQKCSNFRYVYGPIHGTNLLSNTMSLWSITLNLVDWYFLMLSFSSWLDAFVTCLICIIMCLLLFICSLILSVGYNRWCRTLTGKYSPFSRSVPIILKTLYQSCRNFKITFRHLVWQGKRFCQTGQFCAANDCGLNTAMMQLEILTMENIKLYRSCFKP